MVGTMNLNVTIQALLAQHLLGCSIRWNTGSAVNPTGVKVRKVTLLAQIRLSADQQVLVIRTMRRVAIGAVFLYRRVLPQKRPALLCMTVKALFVDRIANQVGRARPAVWLVAVRA